MPTSFITHRTHWSTGKVTLSTQIPDQCTPYHPRQHVTKLDNDENIWNYWEFLRKKPTCFGDDITDSNHPASMTSTWFLETPCKPTSWTWTSWSDASCLRYLTRMVDMCPNSWCDICIYLLQYVSSLAGGKYYVAAILFEPRLFNPQHPSPVALFSLRSKSRR